VYRVKSTRAGADGTHDPFSILVKPMNNQVIQIFTGIGWWPVGGPGRNPGRITP